MTHSPVPVDCEFSDSMPASRLGVPLATVVDAQQGDRAAQKAIYEACVGTTFQLVRRLVGSGDADDVLQQLFLHVFETLSQFSGTSRFETWLYRVATNECLQHLRRQRRRRHRPLEYEPLDSTSDHERRHDETELLETALARLEPDLRSLFLLKEVAQLSYRELAESFGVSEGTIASRLNRARAKLKEILQELGWDV